MIENEITLVCLYFDFFIAFNILLFISNSSPWICYIWFKNVNSQIMPPLIDSQKLHYGVFLLSTS